MSLKNSKLKFPLKGKYLIMVAPSFIVDFSYPNIIYGLKKIGFDKVVEVTFGAKMVNREYHKKLKKTKSFGISSTCPGIVSIINNNYPSLKKNLISIDSPMIAMAKICRKHFPEHKIVFLSPCNFKKIEAQQSNYVDYVLDFSELHELFEKNKINRKILSFRKKILFDKFYNDYTKIYPLGGALAKTANIKNILKKNEFIAIDGVIEVKKFLDNPDKKIKFLDCLFCEGGCIGGPYTNKKISLEKKTRKVKNYLKKSKREDIPEDRKGLINFAKGISFSK